MRCTCVALALWLSPAQSWTEMKEMGADDAQKVDAAFGALMEPRVHARRLLGLLEQQRGAKANVVVDLLEHGLQMATRGLRLGWSSDWVVAALLHDIGELHNPVGHGELAASLLRPYVMPELHWVLSHHEIFQFSHYGHAWGASRAAADGPRSRFAAHEHYNATMAFCEVDQASFDAAYESLPLSHFEPLVKRVISRSPFWWATDQRYAEAADATVRAKMALQEAYPGASPPPLHEPPPVPQLAGERGSSAPPLTTVSWARVRDSEAGVREALDAFFTHGLVLMSGLPTGSEGVWAESVRQAFRRLLPASEADAVVEEAYWDRGDASVPSYNDFTNEGPDQTATASQVSAGALTPDGAAAAGVLSGAAVVTADGGTLHPGWYGGTITLHQDGCYLDEQPGLKMYAPWGAEVVSEFVDGRSVVESLPEATRAVLRTARVSVSYERRYNATRAVVDADGELCFNPGDATEVEPLGPNVEQGRAALDQLTAALAAWPTWRVPAGSGAAFLVDNTRVLHGRAGQVMGRRRVVGGEAPMRSMHARWAEVAALPAAVGATQ